MFNSKFVKGTAAALALATAVTFATADTADAGRRYRGDAAGAAFALAATGLLVGAIVSSRHRSRDRAYYYGDGPRYGYYGPRHFYGGRHYDNGPRYDNRGPRHFRGGPRW